jgi:nucleoside-diphosphate-sugar epimerase
VQRNIVATQRLLEAARRRGLQRFAAASSSSVYGNAETYPTTEAALPRPVSPYGVTKLAAEHLCTLYATNFGVPTVSLRYFTVYGPRQRTDMALRRMIDATLAGRPFPLYGDGSVSRSFTYVADVVRANLAALFHPAPPGTVVNVANESTSSMRDLIDLVGAAVGEPVRIEPHEAGAGDAQRTGGSSELAREVLGWSPSTSLEAGIAEMVAWCRTHPTASA